MNQPVFKTIISIISFSLSIILLSPSLFSQVNFTGSTTIDFTGFTGAGFTPTPGPGQLDSDDWAMTGMSEGVLQFGGTRTSANTDYTRGGTTGGVTSGGVYNLSTQDALWIQPSGADFSPGTIILRIENKTGSVLTDLNLVYEILYYNDQGRANSFNFSYSEDNSTFTDVVALDYTTPEVAAALPSLVTVNKSTSISGLSVANNNYFYLRWSSDDESGSGSMDEIGLDNISLSLPIKNVTNDPDTYYSTIQAAINAATAGDEIEISEGTYTENITINKALTIRAKTGDDVTIEGTTGDGVTISSDNVIIQDITVKGFGTGIRINTADVVTLTNVNAKDNVTYGINVATGPVTNLTITNGVYSGSTVGMKVASNVSMDVLTITGATFSGNNQGFAWPASNSTPSNIDHVMITNTTFFQNTQKGLYIEKLSNAVFDNITIDECGTDPAYGSNSGLDLNLKYGTYENITLKNSSITNSGISGSSSYPGGRPAVSISVRDDGSYASNAATLNMLTIEGNFFDVPNHNMNIGAINGPASTLIQMNDFSNLEVGKFAVVNESQSNIDLIGNWHGTTDIDAIKATLFEASTGDNLLFSYSEDAAFGTISGVVTNVNTSTNYATIQAAISDVTTLNSHVIQVRAGTYDEPVLINKELTINGPNAAISAVTGTRVAEARLLQNVRIGATANVTFNGFEFFEVDPGSTWPIYIQGNSNGFKINNNRFIDCKTTAIRSGNSSTTANLTVEDNYVNGIGNGTSQSGMAFGGVSGSISNNKIVNTEYGGLLIEGANGLTISGNEISTTPQQGLQLAGTYSNVVIDNNSIMNANMAGIFDKGAIRLYGGASPGSVFISNNVLTGSFNGIAIKDAADISMIDIEVKNNDLSNNANNGVFFNGTNGTVNAKLNWWGDITGPTHATSNPLGTGVNVSDNVIFCPWLDAAPPAGMPVNNTGLVENTTQSTYYCSIQEAIDAVSTVDGDTIRVEAGTYNENLVISKALTVIGANVGVLCGSRGPESIIAPSSGLPVSITSDGVTINGFEITASTANQAILCGNTSNTAVLYNNIHNIGDDASVTSNVHAIHYLAGSGAYSNVTISNNCFNSISSSSLTSASASAIGILQSTTTGVITGLTIDANTINDVEVNTSDWPMGKIAYGIQINIGGGGSYLATTGKVLNAQITNNEISSLSGFISTGIGLEGNTEDGVITGNIVRLLYGRKSLGNRAGGAYDLQALKFENNRYVGTCTVETNSFRTETFTHNATLGRGYAIANYVPVGQTYTGGSTIGLSTSCNWNGSAIFEEIQDNASFTGKMFNKAGAETSFIKYWTSIAGTCDGEGPVKNLNSLNSYATIQEAIDNANPLGGDVIEIGAGTYNERVVIDKSLTLQGASLNKALYVLDGSSNVSGTGSGILINTGVENVTIQNLTVQNFAGNNGNATAGIWGDRETHHLLINNVAVLNNTNSSGIYINGLGDIDDITIDSCMVSGHTTGARGIVIWNGTKTNITMTNNTLSNNNCCGIELQDGDADMVLIDNNDISTSGDSGLGLVGLSNAVVSNNIISGAGRFGIEIKNPKSNVVVTGNVVSSSGAIDTRDYAGIAVFRRGVLNNNPDIPSGVSITANQVTGFKHSSPSSIAEGFGIVVEGTGHTISGNFLGANKVGIQIQGAGHANANYPGDGDQTAGQSPNYFGRGNSPILCDITLGVNQFIGTSNGEKYRFVKGANIVTSSDESVIQALVDPTVHNITQSTNHCSIQEAIDVATAGDVIVVDPGSFYENVVVHTRVEIRGANYGISPNTGTRVAESIVYPENSETDLFYVTADSVIIDGLMLDGDNTNITTGWVGTNSSDIDAYDGIYIGDGANTIVVNGLQVKNNIFQNLAYFAVDIFGWSNYANPSTSGHLVDDNLMRDLGTYQSSGAIDFWGGGVLIYNDNYTRITNNVMTNVRMGVQTGNFHDANPGDAQYQEIDNNTIQARRSGLFYNLHTGANVEPLTVSNNTITALSNANETKWDGIFLGSLSDATGQVLNNTVDGTGVGATVTQSNGFNVWNVSALKPVNIQGCTASNVDVGVFVNNFEGYNSDASLPGTGAVIDGATLTSNVGTGIYIKDSPSNTNGATVGAEIKGNTDVTTVVRTNVTDRVGVKVEGTDASANIHDNLSTITGNEIGILVDSGNANVINNTISNNNTGVKFINGGTGLVNTNNITANSVYGVHNATSTGTIPIINASGNWWNNANGPSGVAPGSGDAVSVNIIYCSWLDNVVGTGSPANLPVHNQTQNSYHCTIQDAIDASVTANDVIVVSPGTYKEDVLINKVITLMGTSNTNTIISGPKGGQGSTVRISASGVILSGFGITREGNNTTDWNDPSINNGGGIAIQSQGNYAEIYDCHIYGNRTGIDVNNSDDNNIHDNLIDNNRTGLIFRNQTENTEFINNFVTNNWTVGILFLDSATESTTNSKFNNNNITGNWYGQVVDRQAATAANSKDFNCNWYGTLTIGVVTTGSTEPGYASQIPVIYGGTATNPMTEPEILGVGSSNIAFEAYLVDGTDNDGGTFGFQEVPNSCTGCANGNMVKNINTNKYFCTIQEAIDDQLTVGGHTITLSAGTYNESVYIYKDSITILGPNVGKTGDDVSRVAEAIVTPTEWYGIYTDAELVTIDGITLDGTTICDYGIYASISTGKGNHTVQNNIVTNVNIFGFCGYVPSGSPSSNNLVTRNLFHNMEGRAIGSLWNYYANITDNVVNTSAIGLYAENANQPEATGTVEWKNNTISATRAGIWYNLSYGSATPLTIEGNTINVEDNIAGTRWDGIWLTSIGGSLNPIITNNTIIGGSVTQQTNGYNLWNNSTTTTNGINIDGGSVSNVGYGVWINNWEGYPTSTGSNANSTKALIENVHINNASTAGIYVHDNPQNTSGTTGFVHATILNNFIENTDKAILIVGDDATATANINNFANFTTNSIDNNTPTTMDATCNWYGMSDPVAIGATMSGPINFLPHLEQDLSGTITLLGSTDNFSCNGLGPIAVYDQDPATTGTLQSSHLTIQEAINAASAGYVIEIQVADHTEPGQVLVDKSLTIQGKGKAQTILRSNYNTALGGHDNDASTWILTELGTEVTIKEMTIDATGKDTYTAVRFQDGGNISNVAFNEIKHSGGIYFGIAVQVQDGNVNVTGSMFTNIGRIGVHYRNGVIPGAAISGTFSGNMYTGKGAGNWLDYALDISGGTTITVSNNDVSNNLGEATDGSTSAGILVTSYYPAVNVSPNSVTITGNSLHNNTTGIAVGYDGADISVVVANGNDIYNNGTGVSSTGPLVDVTSNWWGNATGPFNMLTNPNGLGNKVTDDQMYCPWLNDVVGVGVAVGPVKNTTTNKYFCSIQSAIDDVTTLAGQTITVNAGTFDENIVMNKGVHLVGPNVGIEPCSGVRVTEAIITATSGHPISIVSDGASVDGFTITDPSGPYAVLHTTGDNVLIQNNIVKEVGTTAVSGNTHAINISPSGGPIANVQVLNNKFDNIQGGETLPAISNGSASAIYIGDSNNSNNLTGLVISENCINNVGAANMAFASASKGGKGAYGILLNLAANGSGEVVDAMISNNEISNIDGLWAHAIGLEGNTPGANVLNNKINSVTDNKSPSDAVAVLVEDNTGASTVVINNNSFTNVDLGIWNKETSTVNGTCNYWESTDPSVIFTKYNGLVTASPFTTDATDISSNIGFQPTLLSCDGLFPIHNTTKNIYFTDINTSISDSRTLANDVIQIIPADFTEPAQIVVSKNVTLRGKGKTLTTLRPGADTGNNGNSRGFILVNSGVEFHLKSLTMDGSSKLVWQGIRHLGTGTIDSVQFTEIKYQASGGSYAGTAVAAFGTGNVNISNSMFNEIGRIGVQYFGTGIIGSSFNNNMYTGKGVGNWLDYALDIGAGAIVSVTNNTISGNRGVASSDGSTSAGILVSTYFGGGTVATITGNTITDNTVGVAAGFDGADASVVVANENDIYNNDFGVTSTGPLVDAKNNYWGSADGPSGNGAGTGNSISANVNACPYYDAPVATGTLIDCRVENLRNGKTFANIQEAIDDALTMNGDTLQAVAGTYIEDLTIDKEVTIQGPYAGIAGCDAARGTNEAIISPATNQGTIITITGINAVVDGFTINGTEGTNQALSGIVSTVDMIVKNNVITNLTNDGVNSMAIPQGVAVSGSNSVVSHNCISNVASMSLANVATLSGVAAYAIAYSGDASSSIDTNSITASDIGINITSNNSGSIDISGNTINSGIANPLTTGIILSEINGTSKITFNELNSISNNGFGVIVAGSTTANAIEISKIDLDMNGIGIYGTNILPTGPTSTTNFNVDSIDITNSGAHGIYLVESKYSAVDINVEVTNTDISGTLKADNNSSAIAVFDSLDAGVVNLTVKNSNLHDNHNKGMVVAGNVDVRNTLFYNNGFDAHSAGEGLSVILRPTAQTVYFTECEFTAPNMGANANIRIEDGVEATFFNNSFDQNGAINQIDFFNIGANNPKINASMNWWGTTNDGILLASFDGNTGYNFIDYSPFLSVKEDAEPGTMGFQGELNNNLHIDSESAQFALGAPGNIQEGANLIADGKILFINEPSYDEQIVINHPLTIEGLGNPILDFTGTVVGKKTLIDVNSDLVKIGGLTLQTDLTKLHSAIIFSGADIDNVTIINNTVNPYQSTPGTYLAGYGDRNAFSINYGGSTNFRMASGGVNNILVDNNTVTATVNPPFIGDDPSDIAFRSAVSVDEGGGTFTNNTFQSINHDVLVRFNSNGDVLIDNNTFTGGGVQLSEHNAGAGTFTVSNNNFDGSVTSSVLRLQNNLHDKVTTVSDNTFSNVRWGISMENYSDVTIDNNTFTPIDEPDYRLVTINTKSISSNSNTIVQDEINGVFTNNTFNGLATNAGTALSFYNHDSDNANIGDFVIGTNGNKNIFNAGIGTFIRLDDRMGTTDGAFPEYSSGGGWTTTMNCWGENLDIQNNEFDVNGSLQTPLAMTFSDQTLLEGQLYHKPDYTNGCEAELIYFLPVTNLTKVGQPKYLTIGEAITAATANDVLELAEWVFEERVVIDKPLTLQGASIDKALYILDGTGLIGTGDGIHINTGVKGVNITNLTVQNFAGNGGNVDAGIFGDRETDNLLINNVAVIDNNGGSGIFINGLGNIDNVTIDSCMVSGHTTGARGIVIWNGIKTNITITNNMLSNNKCCGIELQDGTADTVTIFGNTIDVPTLGGDSGIGLVGLSNALIDSNTINGAGRYGIEIKNPNGNVVVTRNKVTNTGADDARDYAGIAVMRRGVLGGTSGPDIPFGVTLTDNEVSGYQHLGGVAEGFGIVVEGSSHVIENNILNNNDIGIQLQGAGHANANYPASDGSQNAGDSPFYFGRGNAPTVCDIDLGTNTFAGSGLEYRLSTKNIASSTPFTTSNITEIDYYLAKQISYDINGTVIANINNGSIDASEDVTIEVCDSDDNVTISMITPNVNNLAMKIDFNGTNLNSPPADADFKVTTFNTNHPLLSVMSLRLANPLIAGKLESKAVIYNDANDNGILDPFECISDTISVTINVNPIPDVLDVIDQVACSFSEEIVFTSSFSIPGLQYEWVNDSPSIGIPAGNTSDTIHVTPLINSGTAPITATFVVTPVANSCYGTPQTFTITVLDQEPPELECLDPIVVDNTAGICEAIVTFEAPTAYDTKYFDGFENGFSTGWIDYNSKIYATPSGAIPASSGANYGTVNTTVDPQTGIFSRLGGYSSSFGNGFRTKVDVYIDLADPAVTANTYGWDLSSAVNNQSGNHRRDFIIHTASNASGNVLVAGSNGSTFARRNDLATLNHFEITASGWYTFEYEFRDKGDGSLAVDLNLIDASGSVLWTDTKNTPADVISSQIGGNRYLWFTFIAADNLAIDNTKRADRLTTTTNPISGSAFPVGTTQVDVLSALDACNGSITCSFNVTVNDVEQPKFVSCPSNIIVCKSIDNMYSWNNVSLTDNCDLSGGMTNLSYTVGGVSGPVSTTVTSYDGSTMATEMLNVGVSTITYTAKDSSGNNVDGTCSFTVTVNDLASPAITADYAVWANSTLNEASVADAGVSATYVWSIVGGSGGMITSGNGSTNIMFNSDYSDSLGLAIEITNANLCVSKDTITVRIIDPCTTIEFDSHVEIRPSGQEGVDVWTVDRYAPAGFVFDNTTDHLKHSIAVADGADNRPVPQNGAFYNTQGRRTAVHPSTQETSIDLFIPLDWATTGRRMAGFWGEVYNASNVLSGYPILEFTSENSDPRFRAYDNGTWVDMGLPAGFAYGEWVTLKMRVLSSGEFRFSVEAANGNLAYTSNDFDPSSTHFENIILQGHNTTAGVNYDIFWDNLVSNSIMYGLTANSNSVYHQDTLEYCEGETVALSLTGNAANLYTLRRNGNAVISGTIGTGVNYNFTAGSSSTGAYEFEVTNGSCISTLSFYIEVNPLIVMNTNDSGPGSLRAVMANTCVGDTIFFDSGLIGETILLTSGEISVNSFKVLKGLGANNITISGNNASRIFNVASGVPFEIFDVTLKDAFESTEGGAILNNGSVTLKDVTLQHNFEGATPKALTNFTSSFLYIKGNVEIKL